MDGNKAVAKTLRILEIISRHPNGITLSGISKETKLPKSTVFDILEALYKADAVFYKDFNRKTYVIGARLYAIGQNYMQQSNFISISSAYLEKFSSRYNLICYGCKLINNRVVYVYNCAPEHYMLTTHTNGSSYPLRNSIAGKIFMAYMKEEELEPVLEDLNEVEKANYIKKLNEIRNEGYVLGRDNDYKSIYKCAVPVFNFENKVVAVITFTQLRESNAGINEQIEDFKQIAQAISQKQGYRR